MSSAATSSCRRWRSRTASKAGSAAAHLAGRDLVHLMPQLVFRVVSQVPADATDIRDAGDAGLARIDALRFRASAFRVAALVLSRWPSAVVAHGRARAPRAPDAGAGPAAGRVSESAVLRAAAQRLDAVTRPSRPAAGRRCARRGAQAGAAGGGRWRRAGRPSDGASTPRPTAEGRLVVLSGWPAHASAVTASDHGRGGRPGPSTACRHRPRPTAARLEGLRDALTVLTKAQYGPRSRWTRRSDRGRRPAREACRGAGGASAAGAGGVTDARLGPPSPRGRPDGPAASATSARPCSPIGARRPTGCSSRRATCRCWPRGAGRHGAGRAGAAAAAWAGRVERDAVTRAGAARRRPAARARPGCATCRWRWPGRAAAGAAGAGRSLHRARQPDRLVSRAAASR